MSSTFRMSARLSALLATLCLVLAATVTFPQAATTPAAAAPVAAAPVKKLRVASFNVYCDYCVGGAANERPWSVRRGAVISQIKSQMPDVLSLQEANAAPLRENYSPKNPVQYEDLLKRLNATGVKYALTNMHRNDCLNSITGWKCVYKYRGASKGTRIAYNTKTVSMVNQGALKLAKTTGGDDRYAAWATLQQKSTGKRFFFVDPHLSPHSNAKFYALRTKQTQQLIALIKAKNPGKLPTIVAGDLNSTKWARPANKPYDMLIQSGLHDPLGAVYRTNKVSTKATAERRIRAYLHNYNGFNRKAPALADRKSPGSYTDYILTTKMRVLEWETVARLDAKGNFVGVIPSDHNMIRADVVLP